MKKTLIALAVAGVVAAPAAFAATSNVDVYGRLAFSVDRVDTNDNSAATTDDSNFVTGRDNVSRIGFKGSEDLGGGLSAIWQIESQLSLPAAGTSGTAGSGLASRNTFVGLKSASMGTLILGRHDTPYKLSTGKLDVFSDSVADYNVIVGRVNAGGTNGFDLRADNTVAYITPSFSGFHAAIAYIEVDVSEATATDNTNGLSMMGMYENGPLFASLAYEKHSGGAGASTTTNKADAWKAGLGYNFGAGQVGVVYESTDTENSTTAATARNAWYLSGKYNMGNIALKAAYGTAKDSDSTTVGTNDGADFFAVGADYSLSKRTNVFAVYAKVDNDGATGVGTGTYRLTQGATLVPAGGADQNAFSVGVVHNF